MNLIGFWWSRVCHRLSEKKKSFTHSVFQRVFVVLFVRSGLWSQITVLILLFRWDRNWNSIRNEKRVKFATSDLELCIQTLDKLDRATTERWKNEKKTTRVSFFFTSLTRLLTMPIMTSNNEIDVLCDCPWIAPAGFAQLATSYTRLLHSYIHNSLWLKLDSLAVRENFNCFFHNDS